MNPVPFVSGLIDWPSARRAARLAIPCLLAWLAVASLLGHSDILSTVLRVLGSLRAPGGGVARDIDTWFHTVGVEPIMAAWLPLIVGLLFVLGGTRAGLGGAGARGSALAWCLVVPTMMVRGPAGGADAVVRWWLILAVILVIGCLMVEPVMPADSDRDVPTWREALVQEGLVGVIQAVAVLALPVVLVTGTIVDSVAPEVRLDRPWATGALPLPTNTNDVGGRANAS